MPPLARTPVGSIIPPTMKKLISLTALGLILSACAAATPATPSAPPPTASPPTPTSVPLAAVVNGEEITLAALNSEIRRFELAQGMQGIDLATLEDYQSIVLQSMIERLLLSQAARANGITVDESEISARLESLAADLGGQEALQQWMEQVGYLEDEFRAALSEEILAAGFISQLGDQVPRSERQVHARHILVSSADEAQSLRQRALTGEDFAELALAHSQDLSTRLAGGDLGWIARGMLTSAAVEDALFALEEGAVSEVVSSDLGYHLVQSLGAEERTLPWNTLQQRIRQAISDWLIARQSSATIEVLYTPAP